MAKPDWGVKRYCGGCGARFYDMGRNPIVCPKCGVRHDPVAQARAARPKASSAAAKPLPKPKAQPTEVEQAAEASADDEADQLLGDAGDDDNSDADSEEEEAIEDPSELGEDKDDMFEVMDKVEGGKEPEG